MGPERKSVQDGPNVNVGEQATAKRRKQSTSPTTPSIDYDMLAEAILRKQSPPVPVLANSASGRSQQQQPIYNAAKLFLHQHLLTLTKPVSIQQKVSRHLLQTLGLLIFPLYYSN